MKSTITITILFFASLCAAQVGEVYADKRPMIQAIGHEQTQEEITLTIEDVQDVVCRDNEPLRSLVRLWYAQALHTGRNDAQAVEIALEKLGKLLLQKLDKK